MRAETQNIVRIGLVEDDLIMGESISHRLTLEGYHVDWWQNGADALSALNRQPVDLLLSDIRLPDMDGEALFSKLRPTLGHKPVIVITAFARIDQAVRMIKNGVNDYLAKPFSMEALLEKIASLISCNAGPEEDNGMEEAVWLLLQSSHSFAMQSVIELLEQVKDLESTLLVTGESGVGKELAAYYAHSQSVRAEEPFVAVNCATIPSQLFESELFGYEKGAFTGADKRTPGYLETAGKGTLLLDEIGDLPMQVQVKLLRVLQEKNFHRVGGRTPVPFEARLICATHKDLEQMMEESRFREDLFYRINVIQIHIPPLRKRQEDIIPLSNYFLSSFARNMDRQVTGFSEKAEKALLKHDFPGNVRELRNRIERSVALCRGQVLTHFDVFSEDLPCHESEGDDCLEKPLHDHMVDVEKNYLISALDNHNFQISETAGSLQISRKTLWEKMKRYEIKREGE